jgi:uncharacterized membrane protein YgcG
MDPLTGSSLYETDNNYGSSTMQIKIGLLLVTLFFATSSFSEEDVTTVKATNSEISDNLDLEAVASVFGDSEDLEEFEKKLNDPATKVSNLDLNEDGEVDYLIVTETSKGDTHLVTIQAVIAKDKYQDVATIDVVKGSDGKTSVQVVGDVYMYGPNYIIQPVYVHPPIIFAWFWSPFYNPWHSPFYWGFYPPIFHPWRPFSVHGYHNHVNVNINVHNSYNRTTVRNSKTAINLQDKSRRNDFGSKNPDKSFANRKDASSKKAVLDQNKRKVNADKIKQPARETTGREVDRDWKTTSQRDGTKSKVRDNRVSVPSKPKNNAFKGAGSGGSSRNFNRGSSSFNRAGGGGGRRGGGGGRQAGGRR